MDVRRGFFGTTRSSASRTSCSVPPPPPPWDAINRRPYSSAGTRFRTPTYRHEALPATSPAVSSKTLDRSEQTRAVPVLARHSGFQIGRPALRGRDDFLAAAARVWPGPVLVSDVRTCARYQLVDESRLDPQPGRRLELARIGPAEVRQSANGVAPQQVASRDFIALRVDPSDNNPRCAPGSGLRRPRRSEAAHVSLRRALAERRYPAEYRDDLLPLPRIATMDSIRAPPPARSRPPPDWSPAPPTRARGSA